MRQFANFSTAEANDIHDGLVVMCALDNRPFNVVDCKGFQYFVDKATQRRYVLPCRATLRRRCSSMSEQLRAALKEQIETDLQKGATFTLTFDCWTDRSVW